MSLLPSFVSDKIEPSEMPEQALIREIWEELNASLRVCRLTDIVECDYPAFHLTMYCALWLVVDSAHLEPREHLCAKWITRGALDIVDWLPADLDLVDKAEGRR